MIWKSALILAVLCSRSVDAQKYCESEAALECRKHVLIASSWINHRGPTRNDFISKNITLEFCRNVKSLCSQRFLNCTGREWSPHLSEVCDWAMEGVDKCNTQEAYDCMKSSEILESYQLRTAFDSDELKEIVENCEKPKCFDHMFDCSIKDFARIRYWRMKELCSVAAKATPYTPQPICASDEAYNCTNWVQLAASLSEYPAENAADRNRTLETCERMDTCSEQLLNCTKYNVTQIRNQCATVRTSPIPTPDPICASDEAYECTKWVELVDIFLASPGYDTVNWNRTTEFCGKMNACSVPLLDCSEKNFASLKKTCSKMPTSPPTLNQLPVCNRPEALKCSGLLYRLDDFFSKPGYDTVHRNKVVDMCPQIETCTQESLNCSDRNIPEIRKTCAEVLKMDDTTTTEASVTTTTKTPTTTASQSVSLPEPVSRKCLEVLKSKRKLTFVKMFASLSVDTGITKEFRCTRLHDEWLIRHVHEDLRDYCAVEDTVMIDKFLMAIRKIHEC